MAVVLVASATTRRWVGARVAQLLGIQATPAWTQFVALRLRRRVALAAGEGRRGHATYEADRKYGTYY